MIGPLHPETKWWYTTNMQVSHTNETARDKKMRKKQETPDDRITNAINKSKMRTATVSLNAIRIEWSDDSALPSTFILPNKFVFSHGDFVIKDGIVTFTGLGNREYNEVTGQMTQSDYRNPEYHDKQANIFTSKKVYAKTMTRTTKWSNHDDFKPNMRIQIRPDIELLTAFNVSDISMIETEGQIYHFKNFVFVPSNYIYVRFSRESVKKVDYDLYARALASVASQTMTCEQLAQMASNLSILMMKYLRVKNDIKYKLALFAHCFEANMRALSKDKNYKFSVNDVYQALEQQEQILIPTAEFLKGHKFLTRPGLEMELSDLKINNYAEDLGRIKETVKFPNVTNKKMAISAYLDGITMFGDKCETLKLSYRRKYAPIHFTSMEEEKKRFVPEGGFSQEIMQAVHYLVEDRMQETNIADSLRRMLLYAERFLGDDAFWAIWDRIVKYRVESFFHPGLSRLYNKKGTKIGVPMFEEHKKHEMVTFINEHLQVEKDICQTAQSECDAWCRFFGVYLKTNTFNNAAYILEFARSRRNSVTLTSGDEEPNTSRFFAEQQGEENLSWLGRMYENVAYGIRAPFVMGKNFMKNVGELAACGKDISGQIRQMRDDVAGAFDERNMKRTAVMFKEMDFSTISSSMATIKNLINAWFNDFVGKVCELFGVEYQNKIDATTLLFYYLIWIKNDSKVVKWMIVMDILATIGIADQVWRIIKCISSSFFNMFKNTSVCGDFEDAIAKLKTSVEGHKERNAKTYTQEDKKQAQIEKAQIEEGSEDWITWFVTHITNLTPEMVGVAAIALLGYFGYTTRDSSKTIGIQVATIMRSIGFVGLGLAAMPKVFSQVVGIISWVIDHIKGLVIDKHKTAIKIQEEMRDWLQNTFYVQGITEKILVRDIHSCFEFNMNLAKMRELQKSAHRVENLELKREFSERCKVVQSLYPVVDSAIRLTLGSHEPFHLQFWSEDCGVGKTDAAINLFQLFHRVLAEEEDHLRRAMNLPETLRAIFAAIYPYSEHLNHDDMYYDQVFLYKDEDNVLKKIDAKALTTTMMMLSGFPCLSQQASLLSKGRLFNTKVLISNTNNAYVNFDDMLKPYALLRRRHLFKVSVNPKYKDADGKIDSEKILADGINRTRGEHLLFDYMDNEHPTEKKPYTGLNMMQLRTLLPLLFAQQYQIEEERLFNRNPQKAIMRVKYDALKARMENHFGMSHNATIDDVLKFLAGLKDGVISEKMKLKDRKVMVGDVEEPVSPSKFREAAQSIVNDYKVVSEHMQDEDDEAAQAFISPENKTGQFVYRSFTIHEGRHFLSETKHPNMADPVVIVDLDRIGWCQNQKRVYLDCTNYLTPGETSSYLYYMCQLELAYDKEDFDRLKRILNKEINTQKKVIAWRERFTNLHNSTRRAVGSIARWIHYNAVELLGKPIFQGFAIAVGALAMFSALGAIGMILAPTPTNTSYNSKGGRSPHSFGIPLTMAYLENTEPEVELAKKASYRVYVTKKGSTGRGMMVGIHGSTFLANKHLFGDCSELGEWQLRIYDPLIGSEDPSEAIKTFYVDKSRIVEIPNADAVLVEVDGFRPTKAIIHHFVTENDMKDEMINFRHASYSAISLRETSDATKEMDYKDTTRKFFRTSYMDGCPTRIYAGDPHHNRVISMRMREKIIKGDSGSLVMHSNVKIAGKFSGIILSTLDFSNTAYCGIITQEMLRTALQKMPARAIIQTTQKEAIQLCSDHELHDVFKYKSELYHTPIPNQGISKTLGFKKTRLHGLFPNVGEPAVQHVNDPRLPVGSKHFLQTSLNKSNGTHEPNITLAEERFMMQFLKRSFTKYVPGIRSVITLDTRDAIIGLRSPGYNSIDTKGSAGLPYKLEKGADGKKPWIAYNEETKSWNIQQRVYDDVAYYEEVYKSNRVPFNYKSEFRKKEIVALHKIYDIRKTKTRTVGQGNMIHLIVSDKILKDFYVTCKNTWNYGFTMPYALGVDSERHTHQMVEHLKFTDYVMDFDVKDWDSKMSLRLMNMAHEVKIQLIEEAYRSRDQKPPSHMREIIFGMAVDFVDTEVIFEDVMYRKKGGLLSGYPGTLMINSEVHEMLKGLIAYRILKEVAPQYANAEFIHENVRTIQAADDTIIAVSPKLRFYLTPQTYRDGYKKLGFEITAADKSDLIEAKDITEVQFLKHSFKQNENKQWYGIPHESIVYGLLSWMRDDTKLSLEEQFATNIYNALRFAWWRGEEFYEEIRAIVNKHRDRRAEWIFDYDDMGKQIGYAMKQAELDNLTAIPSQNICQY